MRVVIQRVSQAAVDIAGERVGDIDSGLLILHGVEPGDGPEDIAWLSRKIVNMRIFKDEAGKMNRCLNDIGGSALVVSQFTLFAETRKGNRPGFTRAAPPETAEPLYEAFLAALSTALDGRVASGRFGAAMTVSLVNDGPVTIVMDSRDRGW